MENNTKRNELNEHNVNSTFDVTHNLVDTSAINTGLPGFEYISSSNPAMNTGILNENTIDKLLP